MATETDAARDRVLAARAALGEELDALEASVRAAVDIPAKIRRSPAKAAAIAGSAGFLVLGGPGRLFRRGPAGRLRPDRRPAQADAARRDREDAARSSATTATRSAVPSSATSPPTRRQAAKENPPRLRDRSRRASPGRSSGAGSRRPREWFLRTDDEGFSARLAEVRERAAEEVAKRRANGRAKRRRTCPEGDDGRAGVGRAPDPDRAPGRHRRGRAPRRRGRRTAPDAARPLRRGASRGVGAGGSADGRAVRSGGLPGGLRQDLLAGEVLGQDPRRGGRTRSGRRPSCSRRTGTGPSGSG